MKKLDITNILLLCIIYSNTSNVILLVLATLFCIASIGYEK